MYAVALRLLAFKLVFPGFLALAQPRANPYGSIAARNVFGLKDPPSPVPFQQPAPPKQVPKLLLTGIADFSTAKWAFVTRTDPGRPPKNYTLTPGESEGGLQVLDINAAAATVVLRVDGIDTVNLELPAPTNQPPSTAPSPQLSGLRRPPPRPR